MTIFVSPEWLHEHIAAQHIKIIDGSWHMPNSGRDTQAEFLAQHIPNAVFFDLDEISDHSTPLPHMLPTAAQFSAAMSALGISPKDHVIVYDTLGLFSAARVRWTFLQFGHAHVSILEGGFPAWLAAGYSTEAGEPTITPTDYHVTAFPSQVANKAMIEDNIKTGAAKIIDARPAPRFNGEAPEPRPGLRSGHIPISCNVPSSTLIENGTLKSPEMLRSIFEAAGVDIGAPVISTCGSGVTAAIIDLALESLGNRQRQLYDGSWAEWGQI